MVIGVSTMIFGDKKRKINLSDILDIKKTGLRYIELSDPHWITNEGMNNIRENNMEIFSIHSDYKESDISSTDENLRIKGILDITERIDRIKKINGKLVVIHPGGWFSNKKEREIRVKNCIGSLDKIIRHAYINNIKIAIENLPPEFFGDDIEELGYILKKVRDLSGYSEIIGICLDTGHASLTGNLFDSLDFFKNDILTMHLQDNLGDNGKDRSLALDDIHCPPGYGKINWKNFFNKLDDNIYKGPLIFELKSDSLVEKDERYILGKITKFVETEEFFSSKL